RLVLDLFHPRAALAGEGGNRHRDHHGYGESYPAHVPTYNAYSSRVVSSRNRAVTLAVVVAALGYFVDIYDLILFGTVRKPSLIELGYPAEQQTEPGVFLFNMQMAGVLLGGILWGVLGDRRGRLSVLFGSIVTYSLANLAN